MIQIEKWIPTDMDFVGQKRAERLYQVIITVFGIAGWIWGYKEEKFSYAVIGVAAGVLLASLMVLPPWPFYRRHPLKWQRPQSSPQTPTTYTDASKNKQKKK